MKEFLEAIHEHMALILFVILTATPILIHDYRMFNHGHK